MYLMPRANGEVIFGIMSDIELHDSVISIHCIEYAMSSLNQILSTMVQEERVEGVMVVTMTLAGVDLEQNDWYCLGYFLLSVQANAETIFRFCVPAKPSVFCLNSLLNLTTPTKNHMCFD